MRFAPPAPLAPHTAPAPLLPAARLASPLRRRPRLLAALCLAPLLTGQPEEDIGSYGWMEMVHPDDLERLRAERQRGIEAGQPYENCFRLRLADGSYRWVVARAVPLKNSDGSVREWVGLIMDVHAQKHAQEQLRISEERLRAALQAA